MITKSLERAQTRIEELNFDSRKHVLAYDDVINIQRQSVYKRRHTLLMGSNESIDKELARLFENDTVVGEMIEKKKKELGEEQFYTFARALLLQTIDLLWVDHLETMDYLRSSVNLRAYGQRDPLVEYKKEGLDHYKRMEAFYQSHVAQMIPKMGGGGEIQRREAPELVEVRDQAKAITARPTIFMAPKYGRNDKVTITNGTETREMKFKKAEPLIQGGEWKII
jgi:preprotein translocase subunit SecA